MAVCGLRTARFVHTPTQTAVFTPALPMRDGEAAQAVTRTRRLYLRRPRPSAFVCLSSLSQTLAGACIRALEMSSSHGNGMAASRASRGCTAVRSSLQGLRRCRRGLRGEDGVGSFRSRTLGGVLERRDMIDQELEVDVDAV